MSPIVQVKPGWLDKPTRLAMVKAGYLVVEVPEGEELKIIHPVMEVPDVAPSGLKMLSAVLTDLTRWKTDGSYNDEAKKIKCGVLDALAKCFAEYVKEQEPQS